MEGSKPIIEGYDIFDTVLTRSLLPPRSVFLKLGKEITEKYNLRISAEFFDIQRRQAEQRCMLNLGHSTSIKDIYDELASSLFLDDDIKYKLIRDELEYEKNITYVVPGIRDQLEQAREKGHKVVFISDMYFPEPLMRELLEYHDVISADDSLYVSCDYGSSKRSGGLYSEVIIQEGIRPDEMVFNGNNFHTDVISARKASIKAKHLDAANPNRYEKILGDFCQKTSGLSGRFAGSSRLTRLSVNADSEHKQCIRDVAAGVAAPMLVSFVVWILRKAEVLGLERLYFLSRDGQVLLEIAKQIKPKLKINIELRYLYASRLSWNSCTDNKYAQDWVWAIVEKSTTLEDILKRVSITYQEVSEELSQHGLTSQELKVPLTHGATTKLKTCWKSKAFQEKLANVRREKEHILNAYFEQEKIYDSTIKGIVDIGWIGTQHVALSDFVEKASSMPVHGFFYGLKKYDTKWKDYRHGFHFDWTRDIGPQNPLSSNGLFVAAEVFCAADHGSVYGFHEDNGIIKPLLGMGWEGQAQKWGFDIYRNSIMAFAESIDITPRNAEYISTMRPAVDEALKAFWSTPTSVEAQVWGSYPWDAGQGIESTIIPLAEPFKLKQLVRRIILRTTKVGMRNKSIKNHNINWFKGSISITPTRILLPYHAAKYAHRVLRKLFRVAKRVYVGKAYGTNRTSS